MELPKTTRDISENKEHNKKQTHSQILKTQTEINHEN